MSGRTIHLGIFDTIEEAAAARAAFDSREHRTIEPREETCADYGFGTDMAEFIEWLGIAAWERKAAAPSAPVAETLNEGVAQLMEAGESIGHIGLLLDIPHNVAVRCRDEVLAPLEDAPVEPLDRLADAITLPEVAEPVSEPQDRLAEAIAPTVEPEAVSAPVRDPMAEAVRKLEAIEEVRPLTRKERREYARLEAKIAKKQLRAAQHMPATKAKATAIASRALAIFDSMGTQAAK